MVPSAYDSEDEDEDASPRASPYPIGFKWYHDPNGSWGLTSVSTAKTRNDKGRVGEAAACTLTKDIPKGAAARFTIADGDGEAETECTNPACPKGAAARFTIADGDGEAETEENHPLRERAPDPRREQDGQETFFSEVRAGSQHREHISRFFARHNLPHNFCSENVEEDYQMPDLADQATGYSDGRQDPPRPANFYPRKWRNVNRARKNNNSK